MNNHLPRVLWMSESLLVVFDPPAWFWRAVDWALAKWRRL